MHSALWILWLAELYRQSGLWHNECPAVVLVDLWLAAGWQHVFSPQPQVWMLRIPCSWNSMWWWPVTRNKSLQKSAFKRVRWSTSLKRVRVVSNQKNPRQRHSEQEQAACMLCVCQTQTESWWFSPNLIKHAALSLTQPSYLLCPQLASCYLAPSGGSLWPAVSPVFPTVGLGWGPECCL